jgi:hypothetical protein
MQCTRAVGPGNLCRLQPPTPHLLVGTDYAGSVLTSGVNRQTALMHYSVTRVHTLTAYSMTHVYAFTNSTVIKTSLCVCVCVCMDVRMFTCDSCFLGHTEDVGLGESAGIT